MYYVFNISAHGCFYAIAFDNAQASDRFGRIFHMWPQSRMDQKLLIAIISTISAIISGIVVSLVAPWVKWKLDLYKTRDQSRRELLLKIRTVLEDGEYTRDEFRNLPIYAQIRPLLSENIIRAVEGSYSKGPGSREGIDIVDGQGRHSGVNPYKNKVLDDLARIESEWKLL